MIPTVTTRRQQRRDRLHASVLYLCIDSRRDRDRDRDQYQDPSEGEHASENSGARRFQTLVRDVQAAISGGVDLVQLRDKGSAAAAQFGPMEAGEELAALAELRVTCSASGALLAVNDRADIAVAADADILHVGQGDLPTSSARAVVGPDMLIGLSCHSKDDVDRAFRDPAIDYFCTGPVWPTPTKPGRTAAGLNLVRYAAQQAALSAVQIDCPGPLAWFAIGGIDIDRVPEVKAAGAERIVVVRAISAAPDIAVAAASLRNAIAPVG